MTLKDVQRMSAGEFKSSVLGTYERGERSLSVERLQRLAAIYDASTESFFPTGADGDARAIATAPRSDPGLRVVVIEDDAANRELIERLLEPIGVGRIGFAADGESVLPLVMAYDPELVIIDRHLGPTDSFAVLRELSVKDSRWDTRAVLVVTGDARPGVAEEARVSGAGEVLLKPYGEREFIDAVQRVLAQRDLAVGTGGHHAFGAGAGEPNFRLLFESAPASFVVLDPQMTIVATSGEYLRASLTKRASVIGRRIFDVFPDNPNDPSADGVANLRLSLERVRIRLRPDVMPIQTHDIQRADGTFERRYWSQLNAPVLGDNGDLRYIIHRVDDVTELVGRQAVGERQGSPLEAELFIKARDLERANQELRAADKAKSDFIARVSHELRGPLTAILGFGSLLEKAELDAPHDQWIGLVQRAGNHLLGLVKDLLDISRMEAGEFSTVCEPVAVFELLDEVREMSAPLAEAQEMSLLVTSLADDAIVVLADRQRLRQVLLNLVSNGIKYNRTGGTVGIAVRQPAPGLVRIAVIDSGRGMTEEEQARLFTPFDRLDAQAEGIEGVGLGLAVSRHLVEAMNGTLTVTSCRGSGSTFTIELPSAPSHA